MILDDWAAGSAGVDCIIYTLAMIEESEIISSIVICCLVYLWACLFLSGGVCMSSHFGSYSTLGQPSLQQHTLMIFNSAKGGGSCWRSQLRKSSEPDFSFLKKRKKNTNENAVTETNTRICMCKQHRQQQEQYTRSLVFRHERHGRKAFVSRSFWLYRNNQRITM